MIKEYDIILLLMVFICVRELMFLHQLNKLVNKLMSKNYYDYKISEAVTDKVLEPKPFKAPEEEQFNADLEALNSMM